MDLLPKVTQPAFPDRTKEALEAATYRAQQALIAQEAVKAAQLATEQAQIAYTAPIQPVVVSQPSYNGTLADWLLRLRTCESGGNYAENTGNGYFGAYQFSVSTWNHWNTGYARADLAPASVQDATIIKNTNASGLAGQNPGCYMSQHLSNYPPN